MALEQLDNQGYLTYAPMSPVRRKLGRVRVAGTGREMEYMFPRYIFVRPGHAGQSISPVRSTRGICTLVSFGEGPVAVRPEIMEQVRTAERLAKELNPLGIEPVPLGTRVRLADERLQALEGLVTAVAGERITILLSILGREKSLTVAHHQVQLC